METPPKSEIILYQTEDGRTRVQCRFENENVWMTQALMAELFQTTPQNITLHLRAIYEEGDLAEGQLVRITYKFGRKAGGRCNGHCGITTSKQFSRWVIASVHHAARRSGSGQRSD